MARIVVCGYMVRHPVAGNMLAYFHYLMGLHLLGHEVAYLEESGWPYSCYDPISRTYGEDPTTGLERVRSLALDYGLDIPVCYVNRESGRVYGSTWDGVKRLLRAADLLLNVGGVCWLPDFRLSKRLALVDMDPFFTQVGRFGAEGLSEYDAYFSYGANIGRPGCGVPTGGIDWLPAVPPVIPQIWGNRLQRSDGAGDAATFTTVGNWSAYGSVEYEGESYGQKDVEFLNMLDLPKRTGQRLEVALSGIDRETTEMLQRAGWRVRDADSVSLDAATYRSYICGSRGEFSVAKQAYVKSRSGWFSDRSVCYLAAGLPVVLQDTGFSDWLPVGRGVLAFSTLDEAAECLAAVEEDYAGHRIRAGELAEEVFSYRVALPRLLERAFED